MAANLTLQKGPAISANTGHVGVVTGRINAICGSTSVTDILMKSAGFLHNVAIQTVGTGWQLDFYDDPATTNNKVWTWVTADGKGPFALQIPLQNGLVVVSNGGTAGLASIVISG